MRLESRKAAAFSDETIGQFLNKLGENGKGRWEGRAVLGKGGIFLQGNESPGNFRHGFRQFGEALSIVSGKDRVPAGRVGFVIFCQSRKKLLFGHQRPGQAGG